MTKIISFLRNIQDYFHFRHENDELFCFELNTSGKSRGGHVYGSRSISERRIWMQRIAENLTHRFGAKMTSDYTRFGWAYIREGMFCGFLYSVKKLKELKKMCTIYLLTLYRLANIIKDYHCCVNFYIA